MKELYEDLKNEFYQILGLISVEELVSNKEIEVIAKSLQRSLITAST